MPRKKKEAPIIDTTTEEVAAPVAVSEKNAELVHAVGRRKTAVARIFMWETKGEFTVNDKPAEEFFGTELENNAWLRPFHLVGVSHPKSRFKGSIKVQGSGKPSQIGAIVHAVSRVLAKLSEENHIILAKAGMLTRDPRMVERKKYYLHKARKRPQYSKR